MDLGEAPGLSVTTRGSPFSPPGLRVPWCVFLTTTCDSVLEATESGPQGLEETRPRTVVGRVKHQALLRSGNLVCGLKAKENKNKP